MATHMIPRNTRGEGKILYIFSTKALIYTVLSGLAGLPLYWICSMINASAVGIALIALLAILGFVVSTFKVPNSEALKVTRLLGGENIDDIILRFIKFKKKKNKIYITKEEKIKND